MKFLLLLSVSLFLGGCSPKKDFDSPPVARVNDAFLTLSDVEKGLGESMVSGDVAAKFAQEWIDEELLYQAALNEKIDLDVSLIKKRDRYYRGLLGSSFLASAVSQKTSIKNDAIKNYYQKNQPSFTRKYEEAVLYHFFVSKRKDALAIKKTLLSRSAGKKRKALFLKHRVEPVIVKKGFLIDDLDKKIFSKNNKSVVGPVFAGSGYHVVQIIKKHKKGSVVSLDRAYDEIYNRFLQLEKNTAMSVVMDSLRRSSTIYINKEITLK